MTDNGPKDFEIDAAYKADRELANTDEGKSFLSSRIGTKVLDLYEKSVGLERETNLDALTGLFNRRYFDEKLKELNGKDHAVLIVDMDNLKQANDTAGHLFGDKMLKQIASEIRLVTRSRDSDEDVACRIGGDEYAIIFPTKISKEGLYGIARRLNNLVNHHSYDIPAADGNRKSMSLSVSIGGAVAEPDDVVEKVISNADSALYVAKQSKNSTSIFGLNK